MKKTVETAKTIQTTPNPQTAPAPTSEPEHAAFELLKRNFETALVSGEYSEPLWALSCGIAASILKKLADPQRTAAPTADKVSNSGMNPAMVALRRDLQADIHLLQNTRTAANAATRIRFNEDGAPVQEVVDKVAAAAFDNLVSDTLGDGLDLAQEAAAALLELAATLNYIPGSAWLDTPYTVRRIKKRVLIRSTDTAAYEEVQTTPMQEVYRAVRGYVEKSRAVQTDPRNGYLYIEDLTEDGLETIYHRMGKWADLGGYATDMHGRPDYDGHYTATVQAMHDRDSIIKALDLTDRQLTIIRLREQGEGYRAIASYLGVRLSTVQNTIQRLQAKCEKLGFTPAMWAEMTGQN